MKIHGTKCDYCLNSNGPMETTIELREIFKVRRPEIGIKDREAPNYDPPIVGFTFDFCDTRCLMDWLEKNNGEIPR